MIRSYSVNYDTYQGGDFEHVFRTYIQAIRFYESVQDVPYKSLKACDDKTGDILITSEKKEDPNHESI